MPKLTVLIPTYNSGIYITAAIKSTLNQSFKDYELLIIDDGSNDDSEEIIWKIKDSRIRYIKNYTNVGIVKSLNYGIGLAEGEYIARMDADDIMLGDRLSKQVKFLDNNCEYGIVGGWYQVTNANGVIVDSIETLTSATEVKLGLLFRNQFAHSAVTMRRSMVRDLLYKEEYMFSEDYDLWCRMIMNYKGLNLPYYYLSYRWYEGNSCFKNQRTLKQNIFKILSRELNKYKIIHSVDELIVHGALCFNYGKRYFNTIEKRGQLDNWLTKIFSSELVRAEFNKKDVENFNIQLLKTCLK